MILKRAGAATVLLVSIALLSACAAPAAEPAAPPTTEPTAEPTPEPETAPQSSLPLGCEQVIPTDVVTASFVTPTQLVFDESSTPKSVGGAAFRQGGGLQCIWGGAEYGTGYHEGLQLIVVEASAGDFEAGVTAQDGAVADTIGDRSVLDCFLQSGGGYTCGADVLVGAYWIRAFVGDTGEGLTLELANETATNLLGQMAESVRAADAPHPLWSVPSDAFDGAALCSDPAHVAAALGLDPSALSVVPDPFPATGASGLAQSRSSSVTCQWSAADNSATVTTLRGGAWWSELLAAEPPADAPHYRGPVPIDVPGVDAAYLSGNDGGSIVILFTQGSVISFDLREVDPTLATAAAVAFAATLTN
jgi:hypothetical protein